MTKIRKLVLAGALALMLLLSMPLSVQAISVPDSGPYIIQVDMYRHLLEDNDLLVHIRYNWPYNVGPPDTAPSETIAQSAFVRLLNGTTELTSNTIYSYYRRGWGYGSASMYLDAASAAGLWGSVLTVVLQGSPTLTWTGGSTPQASTTTLNWYASATQSAARLTAYSHIAAWASTLSDYWSVALVGTYAGVSKLSSYGEAYFTNAIPNLRLMVPELFSAYVEVPSYTDVGWLGEVIFSGTAGSGTATTLRDAALTQADDYWNGTTIRILTTTDSLAPQGETALITNFVAVNDELQFAALTAAIGAGDTYELWMETGEDVAKGAWPFDFGGLSEYFGLPSSDEVLRTLIGFVIIAILCGVMVSRGIPVPHTTLAGFGLLIVLAVPGFVSLTIVGGVVFVLVLLTGMVFLLRRS